MCVIGYLVSKNEPGARTIGSAGVDSIGIKWSGEVARDKFSVDEVLGSGREAEREPREIPEARERPYGRFPIHSCRGSEPWLRAEEATGRRRKGAE